jgi:hypothetical protein
MIGRDDPTKPGKVTVAGKLSVDVPALTWYTFF